MVCGYPFRAKCQEDYGKLGCSISLDDNNLPFMSFKDATLSGLPVRIFRISFTGELSYEINTPARLGPWLEEHYECW